MVSHPFAKKPVKGWGTPDRGLPAIRPNEGRMDEAPESCGEAGSRQKAEAEQV